MLKSEETAKGTIAPSRWRVAALAGAGIALALSMLSPYLGLPLGGLTAFWAIKDRRGGDRSAASAVTIALALLAVATALTMLVAVLPFSASENGDSVQLSP